MERNEFLVLGAGVSGLTTALTLAEAGCSVRLLAQEPPLRTTSAAAGASWGPYLVNHPLALSWSWTTFDVLRKLSQTGEAGVRMVGGIEAAQYPVEAPGWAQALNSFRYCHQDELPEGYLVGWHYEAPVIDMPVYLTYLVKRLAVAGVTVEHGRVDSLDEICGPHVVVNCTGAQARALCGDDALIPTFGQLVVVDNPGLRTFFQDHSDEGEELTYYLPHGGHLILGGSIKPWTTDLTADPEVARRIIDRCARIEPLLKDATVREHRVGVRPARDRVRVEREERPAGLVVHNYGHGGSGVTLSWGCAQTVLALALG